MNQRAKNFFKSFLPMLFCFGLQILVTVFIVEIAVVFILGAFHGNSISEMMGFITATFSVQGINSATLCVYGAAS